MIALWGLYESWFPSPYSTALSHGRHQLPLPGIREITGLILRNIFVSVKSGSDDPGESYVLHDHLMSFPTQVWNHLQILLTIILLGVTVFSYPDILSAVKVGNYILFSRQITQPEYTYLNVHVIDKSILVLLSCEYLCVALWVRIFIAPMQNHYVIVLGSFLLFVWHEKLILKER